MKRRRQFMCLADLFERQLVELSDQVNHSLEERMFYALTSPTHFPFFDLVLTEEIKNSC